MECQLPAFTCICHKDKTVNVDDQVQIDYDHEPHKIIENINKVLRFRGLVLQDDGLKHYGFVLLILKKVEQTT